VPASKSVVDPLALAPLALPASSLPLELPEAAPVPPLAVPELSPLETAPDPPPLELPESAPDEATGLLPLELPEPPATSVPLDDPLEPEAFGVVALEHPVSAPPNRNAETARE
jgi:hypothetical protein